MEVQNDVVGVINQKFKGLDGHARRPLTNEGRCAGKYETGKYTSTAYDDGGNSEVFSQAIEFLSDPARALRLIENDPQHAAIVLRAIRPSEYASVKALRDFDKYLPRKGGGGTG